MKPCDEYPTSAHYAHARLRERLREATEPKDRERTLARLEGRERVARPGEGPGEYARRWPRRY